VAGVVVVVHGVVVDPTGDT
jgi:hypothetical protein